MKRLMFTLLTPLALMACVTTSIFAPKTSCSEFIADTWNEPVADAPAPVEGSTVLDTLKNWINFGVQQTAGKRTEFERSQEKTALIQRCEKRDQKAIEKSKPKFLGIF